MNTARSKMSPVGRFLRRAKQVVTGRSGFSTSASYWEDRYRSGGTSGSGSYDRLAVFKAEVLNEFVLRNHIQSVTEFGSGDGAQLDLATYPKYTGVDISWAVLEDTRRKFADRPSMQFLHTTEVTDDHRAELTLSLDVIYHLVEDEVFEDYMHRLFAASTRFVIIYSSNEDRKWPSPHVRHREFTRWIDANRVPFELLQRIPNPYPYSEKDPDNTSFADFYVYSRTDQTRESAGGQS